MNLSAPENAAADKPYELIFTLDALGDLEAAVGWIKETSEEAAKTFLLGLRKKLEITLTTTPRMGVQLQLEDGTELHALTCDQYRVFYGVDETKRSVTIFRILHTSRNISRLLKLSTL